MTLRAVRPGESVVPPLPTPEVINQLPIDELPALVVQLAALQALAGARLAPAVRARPLDRLLGLEEAAARLATTPDWLARQKRLPFRVELSPGQVRWSEQGLDEWIAGKRGDADI
jgi:predicted DNA-binding transcriptional regulator AlpA